MEPFVAHCPRVGLGVCFALNALCSWHLGLKLALVVLPWILWVAWRERQRWRICLQGMLAAAAVSALLVLPVLAPMLALIADGIDYYVKGPVARGIDATYLLTPTYANPILGSWVQLKYMERAYQASGFICYLGFVPLALATVAVWRNPRRTYGWLALSLIALLLALGAQPLWNGRLIESVTLPFAVLRNILFLENLRVANRFLLLTGLGLSILAGYGWKALRNKSPWALPLVAGLLLAEYSWLPYPVRSVELSPLLQRIADRPGSVLDIPFHQRNRTVHNMVAQTVHGNPISGGYLSSYPARTLEALEREPALRATRRNPGSRRKGGHREAAATWVLHDSRAQVSNGERSGSQAQRGWSRTAAGAKAGVAVGRGAGRDDSGDPRTIERGAWWSRAGGRPVGGLFPLSRCVGDRWCSSRLAGSSFVEGRLRCRRNDRLLRD